MVQGSEKANNVRTGPSGIITSRQQQQQQQQSQQQEQQNSLEPAVTVTKPPVVVIPTTTELMQAPIPNGTFILLPDIDIKFVYDDHHDNNNNNNTTDFINNRAELDQNVDAVMTTFFDHVVKTRAQADMFLGIPLNTKVYYFDTSELHVFMKGYAGYADDSSQGSSSSRLPLTKQELHHVIVTYFSFWGRQDLEEFLRSQGYTNARVEQVLIGGDIVEPRNDIYDETAPQTTTNNAASTITDTATTTNAATTQSLQQAKQQQDTNQLVMILLATLLGMLVLIVFLVVFKCLMHRDALLLPAENNDNEKQKQWGTGSDCPGDTDDNISADVEQSDDNADKSKDNDTSSDEGNDHLLLCDQSSLADESIYTTDSRTNFRSSSSRKQTLNQKTLAYHVRSILSEDTSHIQKVSI